MKLDFSALTQPASKARGQTGTTGTRASMRVAPSPTTGDTLGTNGDTVRNTELRPDSSAAVAAVCPRLSPPCPQSRGTGKPNVYAVSPMSPVVPAESDNCAAQTGFATEVLRQRVLAMLAERPGIRYAVVVDNPDTDPVILALAIRGRATCELQIPRAKYDPWLLLDLIERSEIRMLETGHSG